MSDSKVLKAQISNQLSKGVALIIVVPIAVLIICIIIGVAIEAIELLIVAGVLFVVTLISIIAIFVTCSRKRQLSELMVSDLEIVGSYTAFIPVAKITLRMPIEKIDNISAVNSFLFLFTGKAINISSTSGVIRIPYVENADEIVAFVANAIEKARKERAKPVIQQNVANPNDYTDSLKKLAELRDAGIISEEEFNQKKKELLGKI